MVGVGLLRPCFAAAVLLGGVALLAAGASPQPIVLRLERRLASSTEMINIDKLRLTRRGLMREGVADLPVVGTGNSYLAGGPYLTRIQLGNPPKNFSMLIDTGSVISWVSCQTPGGSSVSSLPGLFDPRSSSTSSLMACSNKTCQAMIPEFAVCSKWSDSCELHAGYGPGATASANTTGYYISDMVHLEILNAVGHTSSAPATIIFRCSPLRSGELVEAKFDGILTFAPHQMSFSSQLHSQGLIPGIFSLCLKSAYWGGILVFGEILEEGIVYTPLLPSPKYFQLYLESISVNGPELPIEPSVLKPSRTHLTVADSGTSLTYLADGAYDSFINAITAAVSPHVRPMVMNSNRCFVTSINIDLSFPTLTLRFAGGAVMKLKPNNYLHSEDQLIYCIAWKRNYGEQITVLGDIVLKDKIIVHDLENMLFGWMDFDCSRPVNVTSSIRKKHVSSGNVSSYKIWTLTGVAITIAQILILCHFDRKLVGHHARTSEELHRFSSIRSHALENN